MRKKPPPEVVYKKKRPVASEKVSVGKTLFAEGFQARLSAKPKKP